MASKDDQVVVNRQDLRDALTLISLHVPLDFRPSIILERLSSAAAARESGYQITIASATPLAVIAAEAIFADAVSVPGHPDPGRPA